MRFEIRPAKLEDGYMLFRLIKENAVELGGSTRFLNTLERVEAHLRLIKTVLDEYGVRRLRYLSAAERIEAHIDDPDLLVGYVVAEHFSTTLGYASFFCGDASWYGDKVELEDLYVIPTARRNGIGRALFQAVMAHADGSGKCRMEMRTPTTTPNGLRGLGFLKKMAEESSPQGRRVDEWATFRFEFISHALKGSLRGK